MLVFCYWLSHETACMYELSTSCISVCLAKHEQEELATKNQILNVQKDNNIRAQLILRLRRTDERLSGEQQRCLKRQFRIYQRQLREA